MSEEIQYTIPVQIAGLRAVIVTRFENTERFFRDYRIEKADDDAPVISIPQAYIDNERERLSALSGSQRTRIHDDEIERVLIHSELAEYAVTQDVLLLHGSALAMDGSGFIFTAPSGTGKSTQARLWREAFGERVTMINDDKPFLICRQNEILVCGSPWNGKHHLGRNISGPLRAIAFLERSDTAGIRPISGAQAFSCLYRQVYRPRTADHQKTALELMARICRNAAFYHMDCNLDPDTAYIFYEAMK